MNIGSSQHLVVTLLVLLPLIVAFEDVTRNGLLDEFNAKILKKIKLQPWKARPFPSAPFQIVWNSPTESCAKRFNVSVEPHKYGIIENPDNGWIGPYSTLFYADRLGFPADSPQTANVSLMLETAIEDLKKYIPDENFEGLGIIDWESWLPTFKFNTGTRQHYKTATIDLVKGRHPDWPQDEIEFMAEVEWNSATRNLMTSILQLAKTYRPKGSFGFYRFPMWTAYQEENDELEWLFREMDVLFPSAYLAQGYGLQNDTARVRGDIQEAFRVKKKFNLTYKPIYMYSRYGYQGPANVFYSKAELNMTLFEAAYAGLDGVVMWGDNYSSNTGKACLDMKKYVDEILGPIASQVLFFTSQCSDYLCHGHGRCVLNEGSTATFHCACFEGYIGTNCDKKSVR